MSEGCDLLMTYVIAMQKVVGSNPISRFFTNPLHVRGLVSAREPRTDWNRPRILPLSQALLRISAWNDPDARRLTAIPAHPWLCLRPEPLAVTTQSTLLQVSGVWTQAAKAAFL
jgi:hypothetical protein